VYSRAKVKKAVVVIVPQSFVNPSQKKPVGGTPVNNKVYAVIQIIIDNAKTIRLIRPEVVGLLIDTMRIVRVVPRVNSKMIM
jgi:hypothetical protein